VRLTGARFQMDLGQTPRVRRPLGSEAGLDATRSPSLVLKDARGADIRRVSRFRRVARRARGEATGLRPAPLLSWEVWGL
jgi:hypothetical protein